MTNRPTPPGRPGGEPDDPTLLGYTQDLGDRTMQTPLDDAPTGQADALAWSQEGPTADSGPIQYSGGEPYQQYEQQYPGGDPYQQYSQPQVPVAGPYQQYPQQQYGAADQWNSAPQQQPSPWYRGTPLLITAGAVVAVALAGGGLAYSLTGSSQNEAPK